jgi:hypothetical protein
VLGGTLAASTHFTKAGTAGGRQRKALSRFTQLDPSSVAEDVFGRSRWVSFALKYPVVAGDSVVVVGVIPERDLARTGSCGQPCVGDWAGPAPVPRRLTTESRTADPRA